jgi:adenylate kinase family enzyme
MEQRLQMCDTVIFLDYPTDVCLSGIMERRGKARTDIPWTEPEQIDEAFVETVRNYNTQSRPQVLELIEKYRNKQIVIFTSRNQAEDFLHRIKAQNISKPSMMP